MGDDEQRNEQGPRLSPGAAGYGACEEEAGPVLVFGIGSSVVYLSLIHI